MACSKFQRAFMVSSILGSICQYKPLSTSTSLKPFFHLFLVIPLPCFRLLVFSFFKWEFLFSTALIWRNSYLENKNASVNTVWCIVQNYLTGVFEELEYISPHNWIITRVKREMVSFSNCGNWIITSVKREMVSFLNRGNWIIAHENGKWSQFLK